MLQGLQEQYRSLVEACPDGVALVDQAASIRLANRRLAEILGADAPEALVGTNLLDCVEPEDRDHLAVCMDRAVQAGSVRDVECTLRRAGVGPVPAELGLGALRDAEGALQGFSLIVRDIAERKGAEAVRARLFVRERAGRVEAEAAEAELAELLEHVPYGVIATSSDGHMLYINEAGWRLSGMPPVTTIPVAEQADRYMVRDAITGRPLRPEETPIARALAGETVEDFEYMFRRPGEDQDLWVQASAVPLRDAAGEVTGAVAAFQDVTWQRALVSDLIASEAALRLSEERYRSLIETSPDGIILAALDGTILMANQRAAELHGYASPEELAGVAGGELVAAEYLPQARENVRKVLEDGIVRHVEYPLRRKDGTTLTADLSASLLIDQEGNPKSLVTVVRDISGRGSSS